MGADDRTWLKGATEGERWVWLAGELSTMRENQAEDYARIFRLEKRVATVETRCAGRRWQGKLVWAALVSAMGALAASLLGNFRGQ
jgi:hypothetical protein